MVYSMTGFGSATIDTDDVQVSVEIRTLNSRYLDLQLKLPKEISAFENQIRSKCSEGLIRGKVSVTIDLEKKRSDLHQSKINTTLFKSYYEQIKELAREIGESETPKNVLQLALSSPDVFNSSSEDQPTLDWNILDKVLHQAISNCQEFRSQEGGALKDKLERYVQSIGSSLDKIEKQDPTRIEAIRTRLRNNLTEFIDEAKIDSNRFEQELIYYIEKLDINEEKVRLKNHLEYFNEVISKTPSPGKKLNFVSQEIGREINTIGSKANDATIQHYVVEMKEELEKIKEQLLNLV